MTPDLVTVAIPAYNHQDYVQATIHSVIAQTHQNLELVILNDGSTDRTDSMITELLDECRQRFVRVDYINKENEGLAATWNRALDWSQAEYFYTIASDDVAKPHAVATLYGFLSRHPEYALVTGDNEIIDQSGQQCGWDKARNPVALNDACYRTFKEFMAAKRKNRARFKPNRYGTYKTLLQANYITNGKLFRRPAVLHVGKYIPAMKLEDWYINLQLAKQFKMKFFDEVLLSYRWHGTNTICNPAYLENSREAIWLHEYHHHRRWFDKYAARKVKKAVSRRLQEIHHSRVE